jgi:hypothetical protein
MRSGGGLAGPRALTLANSPLTAISRLIDPTASFRLCAAGCSTDLCDALVSNHKNAVAHFRDDGCAARQATFVRLFP